MTLAMAGYGAADEAVTWQAKTDNPSFDWGFTGCEHDAGCIFTKNLALLKSLRGTPCRNPQTIVGGGGGGGDQEYEGSYTPPPDTNNPEEDD